MIAGWMTALGQTQKSVTATKMSDFGGRADENRAKTEIERNHSGPPVKKFHKLQEPHNGHGTLEATLGGDTDTKGDTTPNHQSNDISPPPHMHIRPQHPPYGAMGVRGGGQ